MQLAPGEVLGYNFERMVVEFTMLNQGKVILFAISTAAMDDLEGRRDVKSEQRVRSVHAIARSDRRAGSTKVFRGAV